jgi:hypothetical protein
MDYKKITKIIRTSKCNQSVRLKFIKITIDKDLTIKIGQRFLITFAIINLNNKLKIKII